MDVGTKLDREGVIKILPHRDPFLFVDKVDSINAGPNEHLSGNDAIIGRTVRAWVHLSGKEDFFRGHFPGRPIMPGVLLVEAMAQASAVLAYIPKIHGPKIDMLLARVGK
jgi:3-hydroxyacyl-[acyl-carrier-protein] dehydratase